LSSAIASELQVLEGERDRIAARLAVNPDFKALMALLQLQARGEASDRAGRDRRRRLEEVLAGNRLYQAWCRIGEALELLGPDASAAGARPAPGPTEGETSLLRIRGIDDDLAVRLAAEGVTGLAQVAAWTAADVKRLRRTLDLGRRISQEGWIEQAALLLSAPAARAHTAPASVAAAVAAGTDAPAAVIVFDVESEPAPTNASPAGPQAPDDAAPVLPAVAPPPPRRPDSLASRLFDRTAILGTRRSLLSAIEAAEQARGRHAANLREHTFGLPTDAPIRLQPIAPARDDDPPPGVPMVVPTLAPAALVPQAAGTPGPVLAAPAVRAAVPVSALAVAGAAPQARSAPSSPARPSPRPDPSPTPSPPRAEVDLRPVLAPIEEEAEVTIVATTVAHEPAARGPAPSSTPRTVRPSTAEPARPQQILDMNSEAQGGEDTLDDSHSVFRGVSEEAEVQIVVRDRPKSGAPAAPPAPRPARPRWPRR
jgi:hypothetical protein